MFDKIILLFIRIYQRTISPDHGIFSFWFRGKVCRFYPTCSEYAYQAVEEKGLIQGSILAIKRISRCNPFCKGGYDPLK